MKVESFRTLLLAGMISIGITTAAHATLLVYEPFNYPVGPLYGQNGGIGFAGGWSNSATDGGYIYNETTSNVVAGTETALTWDGKVNNLPSLPAAGARYQGGRTDNSNANIRRSLAASAGAMAAGNGGVLWMSAAYHLVNQGFGAGITLGLGNGYVSDRGRVFTPASTAFIGVNGYAAPAATWQYRLNALVTSNGWTAGAYAETLGTTALPTTTDLVVVVKYTLNSGTNTVEAAFFTETNVLTEAAFNASASRVSATLVGGIDLNSLNVLSLAQGRIANAQDEIRIGTTFTDVITLPPAGPVSATASTVKASPASVLADGSSTSTITVTLLDSIGVPVAGKSVTLTDSSGPQAAIITPAGAQTTGANGQATFTVKSSTVGTEVFTATDVTDTVTLSQTASVTFTPLMGDAGTSTVVASPTNVLANGTFASTITVTVKSSGGFPMAGKSVSLGCSPGTATISPAGAQTTGTNGQVTFTATATTVGTVVFTATNLTDSHVINQTASVQFFNYSQWSNAASFYVLTTTNGASMPASALETNFPILLRLNAGNFDFSQARPNGADIRFTTADTNSLPYEIEQWDPVKGIASIWVLVPSIRGNTNQQLLMFWGNTNASSQSSGPSVFSAANGYACVLHMNGIQDSVGMLTPTDVGTTPTNGVAGPARHIAAGQGINCGQSIAHFPSGSAAHTTEAWFRAGAVGPNLMGWGIQQGQGKVVVQMASPLHVYVDTFFGASLHGGSSLALSQWYHMAYNYSNGVARLFINGVLDGTAGGTLNIPTPARMYIGGWYGTYDFAGDVDEVRISSVSRSTNWLRMQYQNQNPLQTLVGHLVQPGNDFSVSATEVTLAEGATTNLTAQAGGAIKVYWLLKQNGQSTVIAVDQLACPIVAGRVTVNESFVIEFKAIYADGGIQTATIPFTVLDTVPDPVFTLAPSTQVWDGRQTMTVTPVISNWSALAAAGATNFNYSWTVEGVAVTSQNPPALMAPGTFTSPVLTLLRSLGSGPMVVSLVLDNGGATVTNAITVTVQEPATDAWVPFTPAANEQPVNGQFYARDDTGYGTIHYNGTVGGSPELVVLNVYANGVLYTNLSQMPSGTAYAFGVRVPAGLITYSVQFGTVTGGIMNILNTVTNLVCGDAYIIDGQSNAVAENYYGDTNNPFVFYTNQWIRSYGTRGGGTSGGWGTAVSCGVSTYNIGLWGMVLASNLVANYSIPICIINGAVGGTRIDQHQANPADHTSTGGGTYSIYANLLNRVIAARLTCGIRGVLWHQGENNSGAAAPTGDYDYKSYQPYFVNMAAAWKQDYPNIRHYYVYQVWPLPCGMGPTGDELREAQRTLPSLFSGLVTMSTLGITDQGTGRGMCHFYVPGYVQLANLIAPLVMQDNYGFVLAQPMTAPDVKRAYYTTPGQNEIALEFGQAMSWNSAAKVNFFLDQAPGMVASGTVASNILKLQLTGASTAQTIDYLQDAVWNGSPTNLLKGANGIAALTFAAVPIAPWTPSPAPAVTSVLPATGRTNGGTIVTLVGSNFLSGASVQFGGASATAVTVNNPTQITATTPAHGPGPVNVVVFNADGLSATNLNSFTYVLPPPPATLSSAAREGANLVMAWTGGTNQDCVLLSATNVTQPLSTWLPVATNSVGPGGGSTNSVPMNTGEPQRYYLLSIPYN